MPRKPDDDITKLQRLMDWARQKGYRVGPEVVIGELQVRISDLRQAERGDPVGATGPASVEEAYGITDEPADGTMG